MSESATIAPTGFEHLLGLASQAAGEDLAASIDVLKLNFSCVETKGVKKLGIQDQLLP